MIRLATVLALAALLSACGEKEVAETPEGKTSAEGEVLGGTISDAMLPLDTVTSQSPPMGETATTAHDTPTGEATATPAPDAAQ